MRAKDAPIEAFPARQLGLFAEALTESERARTKPVDPEVVPHVLTKPRTPRHVPRSAADRAELTEPAGGGGRRALPRLAVSPDEAAALLGVSRDYLDEHVIGELRVVRRGRRILIALAELERWLDRAAARATVGRSS
jgi:excisionase family DNA binding protein